MNIHKKKTVNLVHWTDIDKKLRIKNLLTFFREKLNTISSINDPALHTTAILTFSVEKSPFHTDWDEVYNYLGSIDNILSRRNHCYANIKNLQRTQRVNVYDYIYRV